MCAYPIILHLLHVVKTSIHVSVDYSKIVILLLILFHNSAFLTASL